MRSDLIAAGMVRQWLLRHAPQSIDGWGFEITDDLEAFVAQVSGLFPGLDAQFASQGAVAATAIHLWGLESVALLGGGSPTPLTPRTDQLMYYTDINPEVVGEVAQKGYHALQVNIHSQDDLRQMAGATTLIATGLLHLLDDADVRRVMDNFGQAGFRTVVFNHMDDHVTDEMVATWEKMGHQLYRRTPQQVEALIPPGWTVSAALDMPSFFQHHPNLSAAFAELDNLYYVYRVERN